MINTLKIYEQLQQTLEPSAAKAIADILGTIYEDLQNTVTKTDFLELKEIVKELAKAQRRTESRVEELAEAQKKTEEELHILVKDHRETRKQVGGLTTTVGYTLENEAFKALPALLKRDHGLSVEGSLKRKFVKDEEGKEIEINILGEASQNGKRFTIIGESKSQLSKKAIDEFLRRKVRRVKGVYKNILPLLVTHMITNSEVEPYAKEKGIVLYFSYDF